MAEEPARAAEEPKAQEPTLAVEQPPAEEAAAAAEAEEKAAAPDEEPAAEEEIRHRNTNHTVRASWAPNVSASRRTITLGTLTLHLRTCPCDGL